MRPGLSVVILFNAVMYTFSYKARVFVPGKPLQPSLMSAGKAGAEPSGYGVYSKGRLLS